MTKNFCQKSKPKIKISIYYKSVPSLESPSRPTTLNSGLFTGLSEKRPNLL